MGSVRQALADRGGEARAARSNIEVMHDVTAKLEDLGTFKRQIGLYFGQR